MNVLDWMNPMRWALALALIVALVGGGAVLVHRHDEAQRTIGAASQKTLDQAAIDKKKREAGALLASETAKTQAADAALRTFKDQQEIKDATNRKTAAGYERRLAAAAAAHGGRLRDPEARGCGSGGGGAEGPDPSAAGAGAADSAQAGGLFSAGATALLERLTSEADEVNNAYAACRADALNLRLSIPP